MKIRSAVAHAVVTTMLLLAFLGHSRAQISTSNTNADVMQSDKGLFERATKAMNKSKYAESLHSAGNSYQ